MQDHQVTDGRLPAGWSRTRLRGLVEINYGKALRKADRDESGVVPVYGSSGVVGHHTEALTDGPCIVVGRKGAVGKVYSSSVSCWPIDTTYFLYAPTGLSRSYLCFALDYLDMENLDRSTAIPGLNRDDFYAQEILVPPTKEQRRIVAEIETQFTRLDAAVAALKRARANLRRYRASVLKAACEGRLVPTEAELARAEGREYEPADVLLKRILAERRAKWEAENPGKRYKEPVEPDTSDLPELPEGWGWADVGSCFTVTIGGTPARQKPEYWGGSVPWVSSGEVRNSRIKTTRESITTEGLANSNAKLHPPGTVLLAMIGEGKTRGQAAVLDIEATTNQNVASILCSDTPIRSEWVFHWLLSRYEETRKSGSGGMQYALNSKRIRDFLFPLPPVAEQYRIAVEAERRLSVVQELERQVEVTLRRADRLRQAILKHAFEGKLVPQDPKDEPASVLLARMRTQRGTHRARNR